MLDQSGALATALGNLAYTSANGVITFSASGTSNLSNYNSTQLIDAAEIVVAQAGANTVAEFITGGNTYVVASSADGVFTSNENQTSVVQLTGLGGVTGFSGTAILNGTAYTDYSASGVVAGTDIALNVSNAGNTARGRTPSTTMPGSRRMLLRLVRRPRPSTTLVRRV